MRTSGHFAAFVPSPGDSRVHPRTLACRMTTTALAAAATLLAGAFAAATFERWLERRRRHELAWSVALAFFAAGALSLWAGAALGWDGPTFRLFYLFGAIVNVPVLALGTVYLLAGRKVGDVAAAGVGLVSAFAAGVLTVAPFTGPIDPDHLPQGSDVFGPLPRVLAAVCSSLGALVVFGGAAWSAYRALRGRAGPHGADARLLALANVVIAAGAATLSASGLLNSVADEMTAFAITLTAGITLLFAGFLLATSPPPMAPVVSLPSATGAGAPSRRDPVAARPRT
jgi:hypothetical protein